MKKVNSRRGSNNRHMRKEIFSPKPTPTPTPVESDEENTTSDVTND